MKVTDLRRKLAAALAAGGLLAPGAAYAANLNSNLVVNGGFENVDINTIEGFRAVKILDWAAGSQTGFAYSHNGALNGMGEAIPDYANGGPLAGGGSFYFTPNATPGDIHLPGMVSQLMDVSGGDSGTLIASGNAAYKFSAFFSSYATDNDFGTVHVEFLNASNASLGTASVSDNDVSTWTQNFSGGLIPVGTQTVRISVFGTLITGGGPDGYIDNVDFQVTNEVIQPTLELTIDRDNGSLTLTNRTGGLENISGYSITSAFEALNPVAWRSIADNYDAGSPGPNQVDAAHNWSELTDPAVNDDLSEADLQAGVGASLTHTRMINLGNAGTWIQNPNEDLVFQYISDGVVLTGVTRYVGNGGQPLAPGDINAVNGITSADWVILRTNQHTDLSDLSLAEAYRLGDLNGDRANNHADFVIFKNLYEAANGAGSFALMFSTVPEPSSIVLVLTAGLLALPAVRRATSRKQA